MYKLVKAISQIGYQGVAAFYKTSIECCDAINSTHPILLESTLINSKLSCDAYLSCNTKNIAPEKLARSLAICSFERANSYGFIAQLFGLGVVEKEDTLWIAIQTHETTICEMLEFVSTSEKNNFRSIAILKAMLQFLTPVKPLFGKVRQYELKTNTALGQKLLPIFNSTSRAAYPYKSVEKPKAIFPGSWKPLTQEHMYMVTIAEVFCDCPVFFEASIKMVDSPPLDLIEAEEIVQQFEGMRLVVTAAPTFLEKAQIFPNTTFVVGMDTWLKIINPKYYAIPLTEVIRLFKQRQVDFLVFGRQFGGSFQTLDDKKTFGIARKVPQHVFSDNPQDDYPPEEQQRAELKKEYKPLSKRSPVGL